MSSGGTLFGYVFFGRWPVHRTTAILEFRTWCLRVMASRDTFAGVRAAHFSHLARNALNRAGTDTALLGHRKHAFLGSQARRS
jgi:hypothetical protein